MGWILNEKKGIKSQFIKELKKMKTNEEDIISIDVFRKIFEKIVNNKQFFDTFFTYYLRREFKGKLRRYVRKFLRLAPKRDLKFKEVETKGIIQFSIMHKVSRKKIISIYKFNPALFRDIILYIVAIINITIYIKETLP